LAYFTLNIFLRILAALTIYLFLYKWTKSRLTGLIAGIFFGVNFAGLQPTTRVAFFLVYVGVIFVFLFLNRWLNFHQNPSGKTLKSSSLFFALAILSYPVRTIGTVPLTILGETYFLARNFYEKTNLKLQIKHILILVTITLLFVFVTGTLASTPELSYKRISPTILLTSLMTGYPPVITTLWLFVSNIIISPAVPNIGSFDDIILEPLTILLSLLGLLLFLTCMFHKKFLLAFACVIAITFIPLVAASSSNLEGWSDRLITITQVGGTLFILSNLFLLYMKDKYKNLAGIGILGSAIVLFTILFPWLISPQRSHDDQSAFNFIHRYYTLPSAGMGILLASVVAVSLHSLQEYFNRLISLKMKVRFVQLIKGFIYLPIAVILPVVILYFTLWQAVASNNLLIQTGNGVDAAKIERFWNKLAPFVKNVKPPPQVNYIYIEQTDGIADSEIKDLADRITIEQRAVYNPPNISFIFDKTEFMEILKQKSSDSFYAFGFDGTNLIEIKEEFQK